MTKPDWPHLLYCFGQYELSKEQLYVILSQEAHEEKKQVVFSPRRVTHGLSLEELFGYVRAVKDEYGLYKVKIAFKNGGFDTPEVESLIPKEMRGKIYPVDDRPLEQLIKRHNIPVWVAQTPLHIIYEHLKTRW